MCQVNYYLKEPDEGTLHEICWDVLLDANANSPIGGIVLEVAYRVAERCLGHPVQPVAVNYLLQLAAGARIAAEGLVEEAGRRAINLSGVDAVKCEALSETALKRLF